MIVHRDAHGFPARLWDLNNLFRTEKCCKVNELKIRIRLLLSNADAITEHEAFSLISFRQYFSGSLWIVEDGGASDSCMLMSPYRRMKDT
jgi:hypothetical protein